MIKLIFLGLALHAVAVLGDDVSGKRVRQSEQAYYICYYFHHGEYPKPSRYNNIVLTTHRYLKRCNSEIEFVCQERFKMKLASGEPAYRPVTNPEPKDCVTPDSVAWNKNHELLKGEELTTTTTTAQPAESTIKATMTSPVSVNVESLKPGQRHISSNDAPTDASTNHDRPKIHEKNDESHATISGSATGVTDDLAKINVFPENLQNLQKSPIVLNFHGKSNKYLGLG